MLTLEQLEDRCTPATLSQTASLAPALTDWTANVGTFNQFNPSLGTLNSVTVTETANISLTGNGNRVTAISETVDAKATLPNGLALDAVASVAGAAGPWNLTGTKTATATYTNLAGFSGAGTFTVPVSSLADLSLSAKGGNLVLNTVSNAGVSLTVSYDYTPVGAPQPGITFDAATGALTIRVNAYTNNVVVQPYTVGGQQLVLVSVSSSDNLNHNVLSQSAQFPASQVKSIFFYGQTAFNVNFSNYTALPTTAYAGTGTNSIRSGSGNDFLYGGTGANNNSLFGGAGDDTLTGGDNATNYLHGGAGIDTLIPGIGGHSYLFPDS